MTSNSQSRLNDMLQCIAVAQVNDTLNNQTKCATTCLRQKDHVDSEKMNIVRDYATYILNTSKIIVCAIYTNAKTTVATIRSTSASIIPTIQLSKTNYSTTKIINEIYKIDTGKSKKPLNMSHIEPRKVEDLIILNEIIKRKLYVSINSKKDIDEFFELFMS